MSNTYYNKIEISAPSSEELDRFHNFMNNNFLIPFGFTERGKYFSFRNANKYKKYATSNPSIISDLSIVFIDDNKMHVTFYTRSELPKDIFYTLKKNFPELTFEIKT